MRTIAGIPQNQLIFSMDELRDQGLTQYTIGKLVENGELTKLNKGYFENNEYAGEESDFYYVRAYAPQGVVCLMSAAVYYNLTTFIPEAVDVAIPRKSKLSAMPAWPQINIHYYTDDRYKIGVTMIKEGKNDFKIYDIEKTVVDIVFYRERIGIEEMKEVLTTYLQRKDRNLNKLLRDAKLLKGEKVLRQYLEVLL